MIYNILSENVSIGQKIKLLRQKRGMNQRQLADLAGCSVGLISRLERHEIVPSVEKLLSLCRVLRVSPELIFKNSQYISVAIMCVAGKTMFSEDGNMTDFELTNVSSDFKLDKNNNFCVQYNDRVFLANRKFTDNCELYLCVDETDRGTFVTDNAGIDELSGKCKIVAGLVYDITQLCTVIFR